MIAGGGEQMTPRAAARLAVAVKRDRLSARGPLRGFVGTVAEAIDLVGQYRDAGVQLLINSDYRNDRETLEIFASDIMPHFAQGNAAKGQDKDYRRLGPGGLKVSEIRLGTTTFGQGISPAFNADDIRGPNTRGRTITRIVRQPYRFRVVYKSRVRITDPLPLSVNGVTCQEP
jgi:hypothetical protein